MTLPRSLASPAADAAQVRCSGSGVSTRPGSRYRVRCSECIVPGTRTRFSRRYYAVVDGGHIGASGRWWLRCRPVTIDEAEEATPATPAPAARTSTGCEVCDAGLQCPCPDADAYFAAEHLVRSAAAGRALARHVVELRWQYQDRFYAVAHSLPSRSAAAHRPAACTGPAPIGRPAVGRSASPCGDPDSEGR